MGPMRAGRTSEEAPPPALSPGVGGWGREDAPGAASEELAPRPAVHGLRDRGQLDSDRASSKVVAPRELLWEYLELTAEKRRSRHLPEASECGRPTRQGGGSEAAAGPRQVGTKRVSPGWGVALVRNPLELTVRG